MCTRYNMGLIYIANTNDPQSIANVLLHETSQIEREACVARPCRGSALGLCKGRGTRSRRLGILFVAMSQEGRV